jgi:hypothetical protein
MAEEWFSCCATLMPRRFGISRKPLERDKDHVVTEAHKLSKLLQLLGDQLAQSERLTPPSSWHHVQPILWIPRIPL